VSVPLERNGHLITSVETWFEHAPPRGRELHWRDGRSAKELAKAWCPAGELPEPPADLLALLAPVPELADLDFERGFPEHRIRFDGARGEPRNTDLAVVGNRQLLGRVGLSIEAKASEPFGATVGDEIMRAASQWAFDEKAAKLDRIRQLADVILPRHRPGQSPLGELRYQLLTAIAGAWAFAAEAGASTAVFVVHEFVGAAAEEGRLQQNARDLDRVLERVTHGATSQLPPGHIVGPLAVPAGPAWQGVTQWYLGKCRTPI
jgi:hypothetical protein